jgi:predicted amidophosphoribosyltransferase
VNCPSCHAELPEDAVFCGHCGNLLQALRTCARCGRGNPAGLRFCLGCGQPVSSVAAASAPQPRSYTPKHLAEKILTSRSALEGERKQVTVRAPDQPAVARVKPSARPQRNSLQSGEDSRY